MKKFITAPILSILLLSVLIYSCSGKEDDNSTNETSLNEVIYTSSSLKKDISSNFYDNHFNLIEKLGNNPEKTEIINTVESNGVDLSILETNEVKKFYFDNSDLLMYSIPIKNSENKIIIYRYDDIYQVSKIEYSARVHNKEFKIKTIDNNLFYSFEADNQNKIGNFTLMNNQQINLFNNDVYSLQTQKLQQDINDPSTQDCCRRKSSWSACMNCTVSACGSNWVCAVAFGIAPLEVAAGFAASCIGAGPNTFC
ncbi:hypothetical protein [Pontimicrobium sp. MEBiC06410]